MDPALFQLLSGLLYLPLDARRRVALLNGALLWWTLHDHRPLRPAWLCCHLDAEWEPVPWVVALPPAVPGAAGLRALGPDVRQAVALFGCLSEGIPGNMGNADRSSNHERNNQGYAAHEKFHCTNSVGVGHYPSFAGFR